MLLLLATIGIGLAARALRPARVRSAPQVRSTWLPVVAALAQIALELPQARGLSHHQRETVVVASYLLVGAWLVALARAQGAALRLPARLFVAGFAGNFAAIVANGGMPVSGAALRAIGDHRLAPQSGNLSKHLLMGSHTRLGFLGDAIAVPLPLVRNVVSLGDLVILLGVVILIQRVRLPNGARELPAHAAGASTAGTLS